MGFSSKPKTPPPPPPVAQKVEMEESAKRNTLLANKRKATSGTDTYLARGMQANEPQGKSQLG